MSTSWIVILWHRMWIKFHLNRWIIACKKGEDIGVHANRGLKHARAIHKINDELTRITEIKPRKRKGKI